MTNSNKLHEIICSKAWLNPIEHKPNANNIEKMGLEMEMHAYDAQTLAPLGTEKSNITPQDVLKEITAKTKNAELITDSETNVVIGVKLESGGNFSLEPGGQIEYSSVACDNLRNLADDIEYGLGLLEQATQKSVLYLSHGTNPIAAPSHPLVVPKKRYKFMTRYYESTPKNIRGLDMMRKSATIQPNLDILEVSDWHTGVQLALQLVPITSDLFTNSKYFHGQKSLFNSERQNIWEHMDPTRSGIPTGLLSRKHFAARAQSGPAAPQTECTYAKWGKKAYMQFINSLPSEQQPLYGEITFEQWQKKGYRGVHPTLADWETHLNTLYPYLRLRQFLEIRNIDAQPFEHSFATIAFFSALLKTKYSQQKTFDLLSQYGFTKSKIFKKNQDFSPIFIPLLDLSSEILDAHNEDIGTRSLQAYKKFLTERENYWNAPNALEFVKNSSTYFPAREFVKFQTSG